MPYRNKGFTTLNACPSRSAQLSPFPCLIYLACRDLRVTGMVMTCVASPRRIVPVRNRWFRNDPVVGVSAQSVLIPVAVSAVTHTNITSINRISNGHCHLVAMLIPPVDWTVATEDLNRAQQLHIQLILQFTFLVTIKSIILNILKKMNLSFWRNSTN